MNGKGGKIEQLTADGYRHAMEMRDLFAHHLANCGDDEEWARISQQRLANANFRLKHQTPIPIPAPLGYQPIWHSYPKSGPDLWDYTFTAPDPKTEGIARYF